MSKWIEHGDDPRVYYKLVACDNCWCCFDYYQAWKFKHCPECGAKMENYIESDPVKVDGRSRP